MLKVRPLALGEIVRGTVELFSRQADEAGVSLRCAIDRVRLRGDEELLRELTTNLVANAIQYTPAGGRVEVRLAADAGEAVLTVADTGIGLSDDARQNLFKEFYRSAQARIVHPEGTGLGLAITRRIAEMHGGRIGVSARNEGGTVFTVRLPL
jgi:signal transduction histidine kinase